MFFDCDDIITSHATTTTTSNGTVLLTKISTSIQIFVGSMNETVLLPDPLTLVIPGAVFKFINDSSGVIILQGHDASLLAVLQPMTSLTMRLLSSTTPPGVWLQESSSFAPEFNVPKTRQVFSSNGTYYSSYWFLVSPSNANAGDVYTTNGVNYTVQNTISGGTLLWLVGPAAPPSLLGTLTVVTGSGSPSISFAYFKNPTSINVKLVGGGGGGSAGGSGSPGAGSNGTNSVFGGVLTATGGQAGAFGTNSGGSGSGGDFNLTGQSGAAGTTNSFDPSSGIGGEGGNSPLGFGGTSSGLGSVGANALGYGAGGSGGGSSSSTAPGWGGNSAGYAEKNIILPAASYSVTIGSGGSGGLAGTNGQNGANGSPGICIIDEEYT